jgi:hypothetical protein
LGLESRLRRDERRCGEKLDLALEFFPFSAVRGSVAVSG